MFLILVLVVIGTGCQKTDSNAPSVMPIMNLTGKWAVTNLHNGVERYVIFKSGDFFGKGIGVYRNYASIPTPSEPTEQYLWQLTPSNELQFSKLSDSLDPKWIPVSVGAMGVDQVQLTYHGSNGLKSVTLKKVVEESCPDITGFQTIGMYSVILQGNTDFMIDRYIKSNMGVKSYDHLSGEVVFNKPVNQVGNYLMFTPYECDSTRFEYDLLGWHMVKLD